MTHTLSLSATSEFMEISSGCGLGPLLTLTSPSMLEQPATPGSRSQLTWRLHTCPWSGFPMLLHLQILFLDSAGDQTQGLVHTEQTTLALNFSLRVVSQCLSLLKATVFQKLSDPYTDGPKTNLLNIIKSLPHLRSVSLSLSEI